MTEKQELLFLRMGKTIDKIESCSHFISRAQTEYLQGQHLENVQQLLLIESKRLAECVNECRDYYSSIPLSPTKAKNVFDIQVANSLNISFSEIAFKNFSAYKLTFPLVLERNYTDKTLWTNSFVSVLSKYKGIKKLDNPAIVFEHHFDKYGNQNNLKDVDNYDKSMIINMLQMYLISDDRRAAIIDINKSDSVKNKTVIYVFDNKNLSDFFIETKK